MASEWLKNPIKLGHPKDCLCIYCHMYWAQQEAKLKAKIKRKTSSTIGSCAIGSSGLAIVGVFSLNNKGQYV